MLGIQRMRVSDKLRVELLDNGCAVLFNGHVPVLHLSRREQINLAGCIAAVQGVEITEGSAA